METNMKKVYVLELIGDPQNSGGSVTFEIGGISTSKSVLETLKVEKDKWLDEYLGDGEVEEEEGEYTLYNTDLSSRPSWVITEYPLLTEK